MSNHDYLGMPEIIEDILMSEVLIGVARREFVPKIVKFVVPAGDRLNGCLSSGPSTTFISNCGARNWDSAPALASMEKRPPFRVRASSASNQ
jgi:hypothetical protein